MPRDESWLNVNQIVRLVTLPRLPNDVAVLVVLFFLKFLLLALRRFANKRGTYITASFFFHFLVRREKKLGCPAFRVLAHAGVTASWRVSSTLPHRGSTAFHSVGDGSSAPSSSGRGRGLKYSAHGVLCFELVCTHAFFSSPGRRRVTFRGKRLTLSRFFTLPSFAARAAAAVQFSSFLEAFDRPARQLVSAPLYLLFGVAHQWGFFVRSIPDACIRLHGERRLIVPCVEVVLSSTTACHPGV